MNESSYMRRWLYYCRANGINPDTTRLSSMRNYPNWIADRWAEYDRDHAIPYGLPRTLEDHARFDAWLRKQTRGDRA